MYPVARVLRNALRDPRDAPDLLLLELDVAVEHRELKLLQERELVEVHLVHEEAVLEVRRRVAHAEVPQQVRRALPSAAAVHLTGSSGGSIEERTVLSDGVNSLADLLDVVGAREHVVALGEEAADGGEELCALLLGELRAEGIDGDIDCTAVSLEGERGVHDVRGGSPDAAAEGVEVLEVGLVERVADDLDVEVVEIGSGDGVAEVGGWDS